MRPIFRGISSCTSYWLLPENVLVFLFSRALFRELSFHAIFGLHYNPLCIFPLSRSCSEHFLLMLSTSSHYNPSYPYPSSYTVYTYIHFPFTMHFNLEDERSSPPECSYPTTALHGMTTQEATNSRT
jgi:hypothetical protein